MTKHEANELDDDAICACGHALWLHDDGVDSCLDCQCPSFNDGTCQRFGLVGR